jgi:hypothetical protein
MCTPTINNIAVNRTLIDGGADLNIIYVEVSKKIQVPYHWLMPTRPFFRVTEGSTMPIGQVRLPVTFGTRKNYRTESLDFDVAYIALPYNAILGYPALARFMAATHHSFNVLKIPSTNGTKCISTHEGQELLRDIHDGERGHDSSTSTLVGKAYRNSFYWPSALSDAAEMVKRCEACQFHAKLLHGVANQLDLNVFSLRLGLSSRLNGLDSPTAFLVELPQQTSFD